MLDRTDDFRELLKEAKQNVHQVKRRKPQTPSDELGKNYIAEAYNILKYITTLNRMLASVRKPYLDVNSRTHSQASRAFTLDGPDTWTGTRQLSNEERDQIDLQARTILSRCADRVKEMEALEKRRAELVASKINPLARLLPASMRQDESSLSSDVIAAHHASVTWYLSRRLAEASQSQKEMQEERVKRQLERTRTLGSGAAREALILDTNKTINTKTQPSTTTNWLTDTSSNFLAAAVGARPYEDSPPPVRVAHLPPDEDDDDDDDELELSESQILQFEKENSDLLRGVQETLESVQQAESRLMEISALQMELISHLTQQTELTDQLYEDAIATTEMVEKGNVQLREARRRSKDSRLFILLFLIGASLSLLFLHYY